MLVYRQGLKTATKGAALSAPIKAARVGAVVAKATGLYAAADAWNNTGWRTDVEDKLPEWQRRRFHIITGMKDAKGKQIIMDDPTAFADFLETTGMEGIGPDVAALLRGRINVNDLMGEAAEDIAKAPLKKVIGLANPLMKATTTVFAKKELFPDPFRPRTPIFAPGKKLKEMSRRINRLGGTIFATRFIV